MTSMFFPTDVSKGKFCEHYLFQFLEYCNMKSDAKNIPCWNTEPWILKGKYSLPEHFN